MICHIYILLVSKHFHVVTFSCYIYKFPNHTVLHLYMWLTMLQGAEKSRCAGCGICFQVRIHYFLLPFNWVRCRKGYSPPNWGSG